MKQKKFVKAKSFKKAFLLRGLIKCDSCGRNMTGSSSKNRNGAYHQYYHCNHCHEVRLPTQEVNERIGRILNEMQLNGQAKNLYDRMIKKIFSDRSVNKRPIEKVEREIELYNNRVQKLEDGFADGHVDAEALNRTLPRYRQELSLLKEELRSNKENKSEYREYMEKGIDLLSNISHFYQSAEAAIKRKLLGSIFPENLFFSKEKSRTTRINEAVRLILATRKGFSQQKTGQLFKNLTLPGEVETGEQKSNHLLDDLQRFAIIFCE